VSLLYMSQLHSIYAAVLHVLYFNGDRRGLSHCEVGDSRVAAPPYLCISSYVSQSNRPSTTCRNEVR